MSLLQPISERTAYIAGANNLGILLTADGGAIAIDTGLDKDTGRSIRKALDQAGRSLLAIISTHHHADHIGGNAFLQNAYPQAQTYAPALEAALIAHPILEPVYLHMGAAPPTALQTKWLMAKPGRVDYVFEGPALTIADCVLEVVPLAGHSLNQVGIVYDGVCFAADGFFGSEIIAKHGIPYAQDVDGQRAALERLAARDEAFFLPGHGPLTPRAALADVLATNRAAIDGATEAVFAALDAPADLATVARKVRQALHQQITGIPQYAIFLSVVAAHLTALERAGKAIPTLTEQGIVWQRSE